MNKTLRRLARPARPLYKRLRLELDGFRAERSPADLALFHEFKPPPAGGGHQFLRALAAEFARRGLRIEYNTISPTTRAVLFNSSNFEPERLRRFRRPGVRIVHRVDGPIDLFRGYDGGVDRRVQAQNAEFAEASIFQSEYSLRKHAELGLVFRNPTVIQNTPDATIFNRSRRVAWDPSRKIRLIASSWSDNLNKGAPVYSWLEANLDWDRYEFTFVGRTPMTFRRIKVVPPVPSTQLADLLRGHDIYITASLFDPCSNSLLEALACGLPAVYARSGGHPELVGEGGLGFTEREEIPALLERLVAAYPDFQNAIHVPAMSEVASRYLAVLGMAGT